MNNVSELETYAIAITILIVMVIGIFGVLAKNNDNICRDNKPFTSEDWAYDIK